MKPVMFHKSYAIDKESNQEYCRKLACAQSLRGREN